jgi:hypothetical protein
MNVYHIPSQLNQNAHSKSTPFSSSIKLWPCFSFSGQCTIVEHCFDVYSLGEYSSREDEGQGMLKWKKSGWEN